MTNWLKGLVKRWSNWTGDRDMEIKIRDELTRLGHSGPQARLSNVRLAAIQRPGWIQIYCFACALPNPLSEDASGRQTVLFGVARMDERNKDSIQFFATISERDAVIRKMAAGMILDRRLRA